MEEVIFCSLQDDRSRNCKNPLQLDTSASGPLSSPAAQPIDTGWQEQNTASASASASATATATATLTAEW
jgi:hypothetical protein